MEIAPPAPDGGPAAPRQVLVSPSRVALLNLVRAAPGGLTAAEAARTAGIHPNTARIHLDQMAEQGLLHRERDRHGSPGRPAWRYRVAAVPEPIAGLYHDLAAALVGHLARTADDPAAAGEQAGRDWGRRLAAGIAQTPGLPGAPPRPVRATPLDAAIAVLNEVGFTPLLVRRDSDGGGVVHLHTCPFLDLVQAHRDVICGIHLGVLRGALGALGQPIGGSALEPFGADDACVVRIGSDGGR